MFFIPSYPHIIKNFHVLHCPISIYKCNKTSPFQILYYSYVQLASFFYIVFYLVLNKFLFHSIPFHDLLTSLLHRQNVTLLYMQSATFLHLNHNKIHVMFLTPQSTHFLLITLPCVWARTTKQEFLVLLVLLG